MKFYNGFEDMYKATNNGKSLVSFNDDEPKQEIPNALVEKWSKAGNSLKEGLKELDSKYDPDLSKMTKGAFVSLQDISSSLSKITNSISRFCKYCLDKELYTA